MIKMRTKEFNKQKKIFSLPEIKNNNFIFEKLSRYCIKLTFEHKNGNPRNIPDGIKITYQENNKPAWNDKLFHQTIERGKDFFLLFDKNYEIKQL